MRRYCRCVVFWSWAGWVLELSAWPECQHSQHHVTKQKLRAMTCCGSRPSDWTPARSRAGRRCDFTTVLSTYHPLSLSGWLTIFFAVREIICGFVLNADPSHFGTVLWYFSSAKLDPTIFQWDLVWEGRGGARLGSGCRPWGHYSPPPRQLRLRQTNYWLDQSAPLSDTLVLSDCIDIRNCQIEYSFVS